MKVNTVSVIAAVLVIFLGLFIWGYSGRGGTVASVQGASEPTATSSSTGVLTAPETLYDFGTISMKNWTVSKEFKVMNATDGDITIATVLTSCMCTNAFIVEPDGRTKGPFGMSGMGYVPPANEVIKAGENRMIRVVYDPNAHGPAGVGRIDRFVTVTDTSGNAIRFEIKANVTP